MQKARNLIVCMFVLISSTSAGIKFLHGPLSEALERAKTENKPVFIDFTTDWCRWCDTLDVRTYSDANVAAYVESHVIPIKIDAEKGEGIDLAKKHGVRAYPTMLVISADGEEIDRLLGYMPPDKFMAELTDLLAGKNTVNTVRALLKEKPDDPEVRYTAAKKFLSRFEMASAVEQFEKLLELDPNNTRGHNLEARFEVGLLNVQTKQRPDELEEFVKDYPSAEQLAQALVTLTQHYLRAKDPDEAETYFRRYLDKDPSNAMVMNNVAWEFAGLKAKLDFAAELSAKAVSLATTDGDRAMFLDTQATVEFERGDTSKAIALEEKAVGLLAGAPEKERKPYEETLAKFKAGGKTSEK